MATYSENLAAVLAGQRQILEGQQEMLALLQQLLVVANDPKHKVLKKNILGLDVIVDDRWVIRLAQDAIKGPVEKSYFDVTVVTHAFIDATGARAQTDTFYGLPEAVAQELRQGYDKVPWVPPVPKIVAANAAEASAAIAAVGGRLEGVDLTDAAGDRWTLGPNGETVRNGVHFAGGLASKYALIAGRVYALGTDGAWWAPLADRWEALPALPTGAA